MRIERLASSDDAEVRAMLTELALDEQERYDHPRQSPAEVERGTDVRPTVRGRGVARALLGEAMALFRQRRVTFACVWTRDDNPAALAAYRSAGFTPTEQTVLTWLPLPGR